MVVVMTAVAAVVNVVAEAVVVVFVVWSSTASDCYGSVGCGYIRGRRCSLRQRR